jgi:hypothetical protein
MKNKNFKILKIGTFLPLSVKLILETVKDRGNAPTYYRKISTQSIQQKRKSKTNYYGPSTSHKDEHCKKCIKNV